MSESDISTELLNTPVSDKDIATIAEYLVEWEELSPHLELTRPQEAVIRRNAFKDYGHQKREALRKWREIKGSAATFGAFIAAAKANMELVDNVKAMLRTRDKPTGKLT